LRNLVEVASLIDHVLVRIKRSSVRLTATAHWNSGQFHPIVSGITVCR
jgi:hypothetical protein